MVFDQLLLLLLLLQRTRLMWISAGLPTDERRTKTRANYADDEGDDKPTLASSRSCYGDSDAR